jgi:hypothetical protein
MDIAHVRQYGRLKFHPIARPYVPIWVVLVTEWRRMASTHDISAGSADRVLQTLKPYLRHLAAAVHRQGGPASESIVDRHGDDFSEDFRFLDNDLSDGATIVIIEQSDFALEFTGRLELLP